MIGDRCYTTKSGLQIGSAYQPGIIYPTSGDEDRLQAHLLGKQKPSKSRAVFFWIATACTAIAAFVVIVKGVL